MGLTLVPAGQQFGQTRREYQHMKRLLGTLAPHLSWQRRLHQSHEVSDWGLHLSLKVNRWVPIRHIPEFIQSKDGLNIDFLNIISRGSSIDIPQSSSYLHYVSTLQSITGWFMNFVNVTSNQLNPFVNLDTTGLQSDSNVPPVLNCARTCRGDMLMCTRK